MSRATLDLDFFPMENHTPLHRNTIFPGIQSCISKISPELILKSVIASPSTNRNDSITISLPPTPTSTPHHNLFPPLPLYTPFFRPTSEEDPQQTSSPMTIFYNGTVAVFDVPPHKAEGILKLVAEGRRVEANPTVAVSSTHHHHHHHQQMLPSLNGDLPIARKKSLQRFLEKRKERLTTGFTLQ